MARFVLQPCVIRHDRIVPLKGREPEVWDWARLQRELTTEPAGGIGASAIRRKQQLGKLRLLQPRLFVGIATSARSLRPTTFLLRLADGRNNVEAWTSRDPGWAERIQTIYRVDEVAWDLPGAVDERGVYKGRV